MRPRRLLLILLVLLFIIVGEDANAQRRDRSKNLEGKSRLVSEYRGGSADISKFKPYYFGGVAVNALNYFGDLAPVNKAGSSDISFTRPGFGFFCGYKFHRSIAVRVAFNYGRLFADDITADPNSEADAARYFRNLGFRNDIKELSLGVEIYLLPNYGDSQSRPPLNAYLFLGVAVFHGEPRGLVPELEYQSDISGATPIGTPVVDQAGEWVRLRELGTEGQNFGQGEEYGAFNFALPVGFGAELVLNANLNVGMEFGFRKLFYDHLDDVSGSYADLDLFTDPLARILSDRSLEPTGGLDGTESRTIPANHPSLNTYASGQSYWTSGHIYSGISEFADGGKSMRGNAKENDMYFMTQIKVTYVFGNTGRRVKFR